MTSLRDRPSVMQSKKDVRAFTQVIVFVASALGATAGATIHSVAAGASSDNIELLLSPDANYAEICVVPGTDLPTRDWTKWSGDPVDEDPARLLEIAENYAGGSAEVRRNKPVARRILEFLTGIEFRELPEAKLALAKLLIDDESGAVEVERALSLLAEAIRGGATEGMVTLGEIYEEGRVISPSVETAARLYQEAAATGDADGALSLIRMYRNGVLVPPTPQVVSQLTMVAFSMLFSELGAGDCSAVRKIADLYATEDSPLHNSAKAVRWYEAAVKLRDVDAAIALANAYRYGLEVPFDNGRALELLNLAASEGSARAMRMIGEIQLYGEGVTPDRQLALYWLEQAARSHDASALALMAQAYRGDFGGPVDRQQYVSTLEREVRLPNRTAQSMVDLARALTSGNASPSDTERAIELLQDAATLGQTSALIDLALIAMRQGDQLDEPDKKPIEAPAPAPNEQAPTRDEPAAARAEPVAAPKQPVETTYVIQPGDSLSLIAGKFQTSVNDLMSLNQLTSTLIFPGDKLILSRSLPEPQATVAAAHVEEATAANENAGRVERKDSPGIEAKHTFLASSTKPTSGYIRARSYLRSAANAGNGEAMRILSSLYECGVGTDPDAHLASLWLERAAAAADVPSLKRMAREATSSVERTRLLKLAASKGDRESMVELSVAYRLGDDVRKPNRQVSDYWRARALGPGKGRNAALVRLARHELELATSKEDVQRVVNMLSDAAFEGEEKAGVELGKLLLSGVKGLPPDPDKAIKLLVQAANTGDVEAAKSLSELADSSLSVTGRKAQEWLERAALEGDAEATVKLAANSSTASETNTWLSRLHQESVCDADVMVRIAEVYGRKASTAADMAKARSWLDRASKMLSRSPAADYRIGIAYATGLGGQEDQNRALTYLESAAQRDYPDALRYLGVHKIQIASTAEDWASALSMFRRAVSAGEPKASIDMMDSLYLRRDAPADVVTQAIDLLRVTAEAGSARSMREIGIVYQSGIGVATNAELGAQWLVKAAAGGDVIAMRELGKAYRSGFGVPLDPLRSVQWIRAAAEKGDQKAMRELASAYRIGFGVNVDLQQAAKWEEAAGAQVN